MTINRKFTFPVGYYEFHKDQLFNFQPNRWHSLGYARFEDMKEVGQKVKFRGLEKRDAEPSRKSCF